MTMFHEEQRARPSTGRRSLLAAAAMLVLMLGIVACGSDSAQPTATARTPRTIRVPGDQPTIQGAVDVARTGDLVLIDPGTYSEAVKVNVIGIVIRGKSRSGVVLDGKGKLLDGIRVVASGVAIENLTVRDYAVNGIIFDGTDGYAGDKPAATDTLVGYRASYVTTVGNGLYGIYAFNARRGLIDQAYASGSPDSGVYIGQCKPCDAVVRNTLAEFNAIGYEGTNAGGNLYIVDSVWRHNGVGATINSEDREELAPQVSAVFAGNLVTDNDELAAPRGTGFGVGVAIGGGRENQVRKNRVTGHRNGGIVVTDLDGYRPMANQVQGNLLADNGVDLVYGWQGARSEVAKNCFSGNTFTSSEPKSIETVLSCRGGGQASALDQIRPPTPPPPGPVKIPDPPADLPEMPDAATAPPRPATGPPPKIDLASIKVPAAP